MFSFAMAPRPDAHRGTHSHCGGERASFERQKSWEGTGDGWAHLGTSGHTYVHVRSKTPQFEAQVAMALRLHFHGERPAGRQSCSVARISDRVSIQP